MSNFFKFIKNNVFLPLLLLGFLLFYLGIFFVFTPVIVQGDSMYPTFKNEEFGITIKYPQTLETINRFDIVIIQSKKTGNEHWIKRVIGLPGETIEIKNENIYINGEKINEEFLNKDYIEDIINQYGYFTGDYSEITLRNDEYFVLGDNRIVSADSRKFGVFKKDEIKAKNMYVLFDMGVLKFNE